MRTAIVNRVFNAPIELLWKAWTDPEMLMKWWGPENFISPNCKMDFQVNGMSIVCMRAPIEFGGQDLYNTWTYTKIVPMETIEFIMKLSDKDGNVIDPVSVGLRSDFPKQVYTTITFQSIGEKTEMRIVEKEFPEVQMFEFAEIGLNQSLNKIENILKEYLK